ncbi:hypothetical protein BZG36_01353 [Bifiguratus adelaidae]|uniref:Uncharacterized protein n=1 Tax=Bifiguratus adelaidae TaxID=1938954 RepID=A0A261Y398_9FUNG|nr:hypothetical protein BZG36_01353 [Bifiguratus adelaidae]
MPRHALSSSSPQGDGGPHLTPNTHIVILKEKEGARRKSHGHALTERRFSEIEVPRFVETMRAPLRKSIHPVREDTSDEAYLKRHHKHQLAEKKLKNREKERLAHEVYQHQVALERLRNMDRRQLSLLTSTLRTSDGRTPRPDEMESLHRSLLLEAEEQLARYQQLGFGDKRRREREPLREKAVVETPVAERVLTPPVESVKETSVKKTAKSRDDKPVFPKTPESKGSRKSARAAMAFGTRLPPMDEVDFELPDKDFGAMLAKRT